MVDKRCSSCDSDSSFAEFPEDAPIDLVNSVPIGLPLLDTIIEVRDESEYIVQEGMGQIYLGLHIIMVFIIIHYITYLSLS